MSWEGKLVKINAIKILFNVLEFICMNLRVAQPLCVTVRKLGILRRGCWQA